MKERTSKEKEEEDGDEKKVKKGSWSRAIARFLPRIRPSFSAHLPTRKKTEEAFFPLRSNEQRIEASL